MAQMRASSIKPPVKVGKRLRAARTAVGRAILKCRADLGWSSKRFALELNEKEPAVSNWTTGGTGTTAAKPALERVLAWGDALVKFGIKRFMFLEAQLEAQVEEVTGEQVEISVKPRDARSDYFGSDRWWAEVGWCIDRADGPPLTKWRGGCLRAYYVATPLRFRRSDPPKRTDGEQPREQPRGYYIPVERKRYMGGAKALWKHVYRKSA